MPDLDLVLLHAPSIYDFRERPTLYGPISDVVPSTPVFEMYPIGFVSMVGYLERNGYHARIINLAVKMLRDPEFDVERLISRLDTGIFGLDLHWLPHAAGSLDVAALIKEHHPETPVLLGGLSASYYHEEIIRDYPQIDYILRGDTVEKPLLDLVERLEGGRSVEGVENLTWREGGRRKMNPLSYAPEDIDDFWLDYEEVIRLVVRHRDLESTLPYEDFMSYPFTCLITCKGCTYNCITCGGSCHAFRNSFGRERPAFKSPGRLVEEMSVISDYFKAPIFLIGDLRQGGAGWAEEVLRGMREEDIDNTVSFELFDAASRDHLENLAGSAVSWTIEISPETHEDRLRGIMGKPYTTDQMERTLESVLDLGCSKAAVYFMVGLSGQTRESALQSVEYARRLYGRLDQGERLFTFIAPMAPFLDPGSIVFEDPGRYGFTRLYTTLGEHREALREPSWKHYLSYYTDWMSRDEIVDTTYDAMIGMNELKGEVGVTDPRFSERIVAGLRLSKGIMGRIDDIIASTDDPIERNELYGQLRAEIEDAKRSMGLARRELRMPGSSGIRVRGALGYLLKNMEKK